LAGSAPPNKSGSTAWLTVFGWRGFCGFTALLPVGLALAFVGCLNSSLPAPSSKNETLFVALNEFYLIKV
jgi:hypothetical protein